MSHTTVTLNSGSGGAGLAVDTISSEVFQRTKICHGAEGSATDVSTASPLPISDAGGSITVDGSLTTVSTVSTITNVVHVDDNSSSLTVDNAALSVTGGGVEASALRVTIATDSTGVVSVDDNGGSLTVDGTVAATQSGAWNVTNVSGTVSLPTGASTAAKQPALGTAGTASADVLTVQGIASMTALKVDGSAVTQPISGSVSQSGTWTVQPGNTANTTAWKVDGSAVTQPVSGTVTATIAAGASTIAKAEDVASADGDVGVGMLFVRKATPANTSGTDGDYEFGQISAGRVWVSATVDTALPAGTNAIGKLASNTGVTIGAVEIASAQTLATVTTVTTCSTLTGGGVAHDGVDSGNPVKVGAIATASLLGRTPVAAADRSDVVADTSGALIIRKNTSLEDIISEVKTNTDGASTAMTSGFAATASQRIYLTDLILANSSATNITVDIRDGSAGSVLATFPVPATGGVVHSFATPLRFSSNTAAAFDGSAAATTLSVTMIGFKAKF